MTPNDTDPEPVREGKIRWALGAMLLGLPLPVVLIALLMPGCNN
jgi:hypothetical protein